MITIKKTNKIKTETYQLDENYYIDIVTDEIQEEYESWIYNINYGVKQSIFGMKTCDISKEEYIKLVEDNIIDDIHYYKLEVEDPEVRKYENKRENNNNKN